MNRRDFLKGCTASVAGWSMRHALLYDACAASVDGIPDTSGMSLLLITIDALNAGTIGCYGHPLVKTPNLDRFATRGARFTRCYCQSPASNPSRSSFLTGLRPETTDVLTNDDPMDCLLPAGAQSLPEMLHRYHFYTANIGRLFYGREHACRQLNAFDYRDSDNTAISEEVRAGARLREVQENADCAFDVAPKDTGQETVAEHTADPPGDAGPPREQEPERKARLAAQVLGDLAGRNTPFFMSVGLSMLSAPLRCPERYLDLYDLDGIPAVQATIDRDRDIPAVARQCNGNHSLFADGHEEPATDAMAREAIRAYYAGVSFLDAQVGTVLDALERAGLSDETIVVILSDRGFQLGEHGLWGGGTLFEQSTHVPLLLRVPRVTTREMVCDELVELVDLVPTVCDLLTVPMPETLEGKSLVPLLSDPLQPWKRAAFAVSIVAGHTGRSVRTKRWRYTDWQSDTTSRRQFELYDLDADPWEQTNLALNPDYRNERTILANLLQRGWQAAQ